MAMSPREYAGLTPAARKQAFVVSDLFQRGKVTLRYWETDRTVVGGAVPLGGTLALPVPAELRAACFNERRELGIINLGGPGHVTVDGKRHALGELDSLYVGRGAERVAFSSKSPRNPARYYLLSYPAHAVHPTRLLPRSGLQPKVLGATETQNHRILHQVIHQGSIPTCQLVMGFTLVQPGSKWNTMPPHRHFRRSEVYCYFGFPPRGSVKHFMGPPEDIRTMKLGDGDVALSPPWSIHSGEGSSHYGFVWGMGGENLDYTDMDPVDPQLVLRAR